jgi:YbbR domain-containing protein
MKPESWFKKDLGLKCFSLLVAILLSYFVNSEGNTTVVGFIVPVEIKNIPKNKLLIWPLNRQAQVTIRGPSFLVSGVASSPPAFEVEVPPDVESRFIAALKSSDLALPPAIEVMSIEPSELELTFDNLISKEFLVEVPRIGKLAENLELGELSIHPSKVVLRGPQTEVGKIERIETYPLDLRDLTTDESRELSLRIPGALSEPSVKQVRVEVRLNKVQKERLFHDLPVEIRLTSGAPVRVAPDLVDVEVSGPIDIVQKLRPEELNPFVRIRSGDSIGQQAEVLVDLPKGVVLVAVEPPRVSVMPREGGALGADPSAQGKGKPR